MQNKMVSAVAPLVPSQKPPQVTQSRLAGSSRSLDRPAILDPEEVRRWCADFFAEYEPQGPTEVAVVRDLARQAAAAERWSETAAAAFRQAAVGLPALFAAVPVQHDGDQMDSLLAAAAASDSTDRAARHSLGHSRAFFRALQKLLELQARRRSLSALAELEPPPAFRSEAECEAYLAARFANGKNACPRCAGQRGYYFAKRRAWECAGCKLQVGLRAGTVMAGSQLSLIAWFEAVRLLLWAPTLNTAQLADKLGIPRLATVRKIAAKIRAAMADEQASQKLAGLDEHFARSQAAHSHPAPSHPALNHPPLSQALLSQALLSQALLNQAPLGQASLRVNQLTQRAPPQTTAALVTQAQPH